MVLVSHLGTDYYTYYPTLLMAWEKKWRMAQVRETLHTHGLPRRMSWVPALEQLRTSYWRPFWGFGKPADERFCVEFAFQIKLGILKDETFELIFVYTLIYMRNHFITFYAVGIVHASLAHLFCIIIYQGHVLKYFAGHSLQGRPYMSILTCWCWSIDTQCGGKQDPFFFQNY